MSESESPMDPQRPDEHDELFAFEADATGGPTAVPANPSTTVRAFSLQPHPSLMRWLAEHNPFYLLSAACMLAGCLALTNSLSWVSITPGRLVTPPRAVTVVRPKRATTGSRSVSPFVPSTVA